MLEQRIALVTGANRGIGLATTRALCDAGFHVIITARNAQRGAKALATLQREKRSVELRKLDVTGNADAQSLAAWLEETYGRLDVLINNAGILPESSRETGARSADPLRVAPATVLEILNTNTLGPLRMIQALARLMPAGGRIINISSWMGQFKRLEDRHLGYRMSKTALNVVTRVLALRLAEQGVQVQSVCPGWVRTDMGGEKAETSPEEAAANIVWLATSPEVTETGGFWRNRHRVDW